MAKYSGARVGRCWYETCLEPCWLPPCVLGTVEIIFCTIHGFVWARDLAEANSKLEVRPETIFYVLLCWPAATLITPQKSWSFASTGHSSQLSRDPEDFKNESWLRNTHLLPGLLVWSPFRPQFWWTLSSHKLSVHKQFGVIRKVLRNAYLSPTVAILYNHVLP